MHRIPPDHPLRRLFDGLVEQTFMVDLGICDTQLTHYLAEMLADFVHADQIFRMRTVSGDTIYEVSRVETDACLGPSVDHAARHRLLNRYIGDFTLFWTGVYPESLRRTRPHGDRLQEYFLRGKRSYAIASELTGPEGRPPAALLRQLSREFECCAHGLQLVRSQWERTRDGSN